MSADTEFVGAYYEMPDADVEPSLLSPWVLRLCVDKEKLEDLEAVGISLDDVSERIERSLGAAWHIICSDPNAGQHVLRVRHICGSAAEEEDSEEEETTAEDAALVEAAGEEAVMAEAAGEQEGDEEATSVVGEAAERKILQRLADPSSALMALTLCGIPTISAAFLRQRRTETFDDSGTGHYQPEWLVDATGSDLLAAMTFDPKVDPTRCVSNDPAEVLRVLGVEAARAQLLHEVNRVTEYAAWDWGSRRHAQLLCDVMTHGGGLALPPGDSWLVPQGCLRPEPRDDRDRGAIKRPSLYH